eukprot:TRINITY_DN22608_c0_g2_i1.p1 TRINITY_DN22608_c0_g2~~TRINITY_DN22608_c0_g2_i1.p1  ORF type:complete len:246 (-),score=35.89 TRINITY_DN22608_c0_g2_i1:179-916(-)
MGRWHPFSQAHAYKVTLDEMRRFHSGRWMSGSDWTGLLVAAVIAGVGLATDSTVSVVASMLVSPLMSPILQVSYALADPGCEVKWKSVATFISGIVVCLLAGAAVGAASYYTGVVDSYHWPTDEMRGRMKSKSLLPSFVIALASGIGAANAVIPVKGKGVRSNDLVGVAISASLLPPLVNSGMLVIWGILTPHPTKEAAKEASISFALTAINVFGIILSASGFYRATLRQMEREDSTHNLLGAAA